MEEIDQRFRVLDVIREIGPAHIRLDVLVARRVVELAPGRVERGNALVARTGQVEHGQI
jgi:hypothetical protein